jgi:hypothetical protein
MKKVILLLSLAFLIQLNLSMTDIPNRKAASYKEKLSDYGLFQGEIKVQNPAAGVVPYNLVSPLFSDYAQKLRFIQLPVGDKTDYNPDAVLQFPIGTVIAKTFYYNNDDKKPEKGRRLIETRILIHENEGWIALPYVWDEGQTEAYLDVAGTDTRVTYKDNKGVKKEFTYQVPNMNQCRNCHEKNGVITPIGPSARQLNSDFNYGQGNENQLKHWQDENLISSLPANKESIPAFVNYNDASQTLESRAIAYLDVNCAHCHNKAGQAQTSGLFLDWKTTDRTAYGFFKTPIAAGRGSGGLQYDIVPGKAEESILWYRMASTDPGVMMPELGRTQNHQEGINLIKNWINSLQ